MYNKLIQLYKYIHICTQEKCRWLCLLLVINVEQNRKEPTKTIFPQDVLLLPKLES